MFKQASRKTPQVYTKNWVNSSNPKTEFKDNQRTENYERERVRNTNTRLQGSPPNSGVTSLVSYLRESSSQIHYQDRSLQ